MVRASISTLLTLGALLLAGPVAAQSPMTTLQAKCVRETNRAYRKLSAVYGAEYAGCVKSVRDSGGSYDTCIAGVEQNLKVRKAQQRVRQIADTRCTVTPPFGYSSPDTVIQAAAAQERALVQKLFGTDVAAALTPAKAVCQSNLLKTLQKCRDTSLGAFDECSQYELQTLEGPNYTRELADRCLRQGVFVEKRLTGLPTQLFKNCRVAPSKAGEGGCGITTLAEFGATFPGDCAGVHPWNVCLKGVVGCTTCRAIDAADALGIAAHDFDSCDVADDDQENGSCAP